MRGGIYDPFSHIGDYGSDEAQDVSTVKPSIHMGIVKSYDSTLKTCMVLVPSINDLSTIGPCKMLKPYNSTGFVAPVKGDKVVVAFLDSKLSQLVILGKLA
jgi:hypothetical protein